MLKKCNAKPRKKIYRYIDINHIELWRDFINHYIHPYGYPILKSVTVYHDYKYCTAITEKDIVTYMKNIKRR